MKKTFLCFIATLLILISGISLVGCDMGTGTPAIPDYNADVQVVEPENIDVENFIAEEDTTYYTSPGFSLWMEVNGAFMEMDYFSLDGDKRVYDNLYFYVDDYFYIVTDDYKDLYASLGDSADLEYAEEEKEQGYDIQINVKKAGIYKLTFDVKTLKFDMEYKAEIETPVYYSIRNCSIYSKATSWVEMSVNPANVDEFVISNFSIGAGETVSFYNNVHVSNYKVSQLQTLKVKVNCGNNVIAEIDEELAALGKQNSLYSQMLANGVIDEITYHEKADKIKGKIEELRSRRLKIINDDEEETCLEELRQLRRMIDESPDYLTEMDKGLFGKIVKKIYAEEDGSLSFVLQGDLELRVCMEDRNDEQND